MTTESSVFRSVRNRLLMSIRSFSDDERLNPFEFCSTIDCSLANRLLTIDVVGNVSENGESGSTVSLTMLFGSITYREKRRFAFHCRDESYLRFG